MAVGIDYQKLNMALAAYEQPPMAAMPDPGLGAGPLRGQPKKLPRTRISLTGVEGIDAGILQAFQRYAANWSRNYNRLLNEGLSDSEIHSRIGPVPQRATADDVFRYEGALGSAEKEDRLELMRLQFQYDERMYGRRVADENAARNAQMLHDRELQTERLKADETARAQTQGFQREMFTEEQELTDTRRAEDRNERRAETEAERAERLGVRAEDVEYRKSRDKVEDIRYDKASADQTQESQEKRQLTEDEKQEERIDIYLSKFYEFKRQFRAERVTLSKPEDRDALEREYKDELKRMRDIWVKRYKIDPSELPRW